MVTNGFFSGDFNGHFSVHLTWISRRKYPWLTILAFSWHLWHTLLAFLLAFWVFVFHLLYKLSLFCATCIYLHSSGQSLGYSFSPYSLSSSESLKLFWTLPIIGHISYIIDLYTHMCKFTQIKLKQKFNETVPFLCAMKPLISSVLFHI